MLNGDRKAAIIIPALNPGSELLAYVEKIKENGERHIIVIDDGSTEKTRDIFDKLKVELQCTVLRHAINMGKGRALKTAFNYYLTHLSDKCTGVITVDSDGQHDIKDIIRLEKAMNENSDSLIIGARDFDSPNVPPKSKIGNKTTKIIMKLLYGGEITDTQTGLRGIPNSLVKEYLLLPGERFEYETSMLIESLQKKITIKEIGIETIYIDDNSGTHFRPIADSWAIYKLIFGTFFKYILSSVSSFLVDLLMFQLLLLLFGGFSLGSRILYATIGARICSSIFNYIVNRHIVFEGDHKGKNTFFKYYLLCILQMFASAGGVYLICSLIPIPEFLAKLIFDSILFLISFQIQRRWIFTSKFKEVQK